MAAEEQSQSEEQRAAVLHDPAQRRSPLAEEKYAGDIQRFLGGPMGRFSRVGTQPFWTPLFVLMSIASGFLALGFITKANCLSGYIDDEGVAVLNWANKIQYTSACYSDIIPLFRGRGLDVGGNPFTFSWQEGDLTRYNEYPVLATMFMAVMGGCARLLTPVIQLVVPSMPAASVYFILTAIVFAVLWLVVVRWTAHLAGNRPWDAMLVAASPLVIVHAFTNWDIPAIYFALAAFMALSKGKHVTGGVLVGLGTAFKMWPLFILGAYLVIAVRQRQLGGWLKTFGCAAGTWLLINLPVRLLYPESWNEFSRLNQERGWDWLTIYAVIARYTGWTGFDPAGETPVILNMVTLLLFVGSCVAIAIFGWKLQRQPRIAELSFLILVAFLFFNKVWSAQYSIWLVPLAALALPNWPLVFAWGVSELILWPMFTLTMLGTDSMGVPSTFLNLFIIARDILVLAMAWQVIQQMRGKREDKVYRDNNGYDLLLGRFLGEPQQVTDLPVFENGKPVADDAASAEDDIDAADDATTATDDAVAGASVMAPDTRASGRPAQQQFQ